jgi:hypothetical protein
MSDCCKYSALDPKPQNQQHSTSKATSKAKRLIASMQEHLAFNPNVIGKTSSTSGLDRDICYMYAKAQAGNLRVRF